MMFYDRDNILHDTAKEMYAADLKSWINSKRKKYNEIKVEKDVEVVEIEPDE